MTVKLVWHGTGVQCLYSGQCTINDIITASTQVKGNQNATSLTYCIHDFTQAESLEAGSVAVAIIAVNMGTSLVNGAIRIGLAMSEAMASLSNARLHSSTASRPTRVFNNGGDALAWALNTAA